MTPTIQDVIEALDVYSDAEICRCALRYKLASTSTEFWTGVRASGLDATNYVTSLYACWKRINRGI
jgi:hypothetical protein